MKKRRNRVILAINQMIVLLLYLQQLLLMIIKMLMVMIMVTERMTIQMVMQTVTTPMEEIHPVKQPRKERIKRRNELVIAILFL